MHHKTGKDRRQIVLIPTCLDDIISGDNPVRLIDAFVDALEMDSHGFVHVQPKEKGAPPYEPGTLLKIYLYGYLNRLRSSRRLENACTNNIELMWLTQQLTPSHSTIATFRRENKKPLKETFRTFNRFCRGEDLFGKETVAVDGSKFRAQNSKKNNFNEKKVERALAYHDRKIEEYLTALEENDEGEKADETWKKLHRSTAQFLRHRELGEELAAAKENGERQVSTSDPDARALPLHMNIVEVGYNVQTATDEKHNMVAHFEVTNQKDDYALSGVATKAKMELGLKKEENLNVLADKGYCTGSELKKCEDGKIATYVAPKENRGNGKSNVFSKTDFVYNPDRDAYICPFNEELTSNGSWYEKKGRLPGASPYRFKRYTIYFGTCNACPFRDECLSPGRQKHRQGRYIERSEFEDCLEANKERVENDRELYRKRQSIAEHPFGTIKRQWGYTFTLLKTIEKVEAEFALIFTAYNMKRAMTILGTSYLINKLKGMKNSLKGLFFKEMNVWRSTEHLMFGKIFLENKINYGSMGICGA